jgi:parvulin-like peptidyl-prolyl isomerase
VHPEVEKAAFSLQPGEVSSVITTPEGILVLKMDKVIPPETSVKFEDKKEDLRKEVFEKKVSAEIPVVFKKMREEAKPNLILKRTNDPVAQQEDAKRTLQEDGMIKPASARSPK